MTTEKEKMLAGEFYYAADPELSTERAFARSLLKQLNIEGFGDRLKYHEVLIKLLPNCPPDIEIEPPFYCDYGYNILAGKKVFLNYDCVILDACTVSIGSFTMLGPGVHIYTATHPVDYELRRIEKEFGRPVTIGDDCWIGGHATILPGITIGNRCIIGAGAVVTRDVPNDTTVVGNPARVVPRKDESV